MRNQSREEFYVGEQLRARRKRLGLRIRDVTNKADCSDGTLSLIERDIRIPRYDLYLRLVRALDSFEAEQQTA
jgi:transcriptional regulator with XRE-family HTH domain